MVQINSSRLMAAALLLAAGLTLSACGKKQAPKPQGGPPEVGVITVQTQRVALTTELSGRTRPARESSRHNPGGLGIVW